ncbi:MAG: sugar ABC transporter ATP-binding protein [Planctomycetes bacterium]|nr:sugar ABC transporter ATP-binding protein [Planctomycetota bacterium]
MRNISKRFGGVQALDTVSLAVRPGEVRALMGENGAGKSTLMKILAGAYPKDDGDIFIHGEKRRIDSPKAAIDLGVSVIYQEFMLAKHLSVAENIFIDRMAGGNFFINWAKLYEQAREQLDRLGFGEIDPSTPVGNLSIAYQQVVEICKCLTRNSRILVLDEQPTAVLTFSEIRKLFGIIDNLRRSGVAIIYISHRLEEIFEIADSITVLKDGHYVDTVRTADTNKNELVTMMVGREMNQLFPERHATIGDVVLTVENLNAGPMVRDVAFSVRSGEVLGFSGLVGAGRSETMRAIFGADRKESGTVTLDGEPANFKSARQAVRGGLGMLPEDRKNSGLLLKQSIRVNTTLAAAKKVSRRGFINHQSERKYVEEVLATLRAKYGDMDDNADSLSGGNQQKIALAKWIMVGSKVLVLDEPSRGVDVGAKMEIYRIINGLAERGVAIIFISSEMTEIIGMCDRVVVMRSGGIAGELAGDDITETNLIKLSMGVA